MNLNAAIQYVRQYRRNGKSCYIHAANRNDVSFSTNVGTLRFICEKCRYRHGGKSKWWRAYLRFDNGSAVPSKLFATIHEIEA